MPSMSKKAINESQDSIHTNNSMKQDKILAKDDNGQFQMVQ